MLGKIFRIAFERQYVLLDESPCALSQVFDFRRKREIHPSVSPANLPANPYLTGATPSPHEVL
jgi:hypothetical protein